MTIKYDDIRIILKGPMNKQSTARGLRFLDTEERNEYAARVQVRTGMNGGKSEWTDVKIIKEEPR